MLKDEITKAVGAHGLWKSRLRRAIDTGTSDFTSEGVKPDDRCDFGRWLHAVPAEERNEHHQHVAALHADFHREAANVLRLVEAGDKAGARKAMSPGSKFEQLTSELTQAMTDWGRAA